MCAEQAWVEPDAGDPLADQPSILTCRNSSVAAATAGKEVLTRLLVGGSDVVVDGLTGLLGHLEPDRLAGLLLAHRRAIDSISVRRHIFRVRGSRERAGDCVEVAIGGFSEVPVGLTRTADRYLLADDHVDFDRLYQCSPRRRTTAQGSC